MRETSRRKWHGLQASIQRGLTSEKHFGRIRARERSPEVRPPKRFQRPRTRQRGRRLICFTGPRFYLQAFGVVSPAPSREAHDANAVFGGTIVALPRRRLATTPWPIFQRIGDHGDATEFPSHKTVCGDVVLTPRVVAASPRPIANCVQLRKSTRRIVEITWSLAGCWQGEFSKLIGNVKM